MQSYLTELSNYLQFWQYAHHQKYQTSETTHFILLQILNKPVTQASCIKRYAISTKTCGYIIIQKQNKDVVLSNSILVDKFNCTSFRYVNYIIQWWTVFF